MAIFRNLNRTRRGPGAARTAETARRAGRSAAIVLALALLGQPAGGARPAPSRDSVLEPAPSEPVLFEPGRISTGFDDSHLAFAPDGKSLYVLRNSADFAHWTILTSKLVGSQWSEPEVASFSGLWDDADVFVTEDSNHLFFISKRPAPGRSAGRRDTDIWYMARAGGRWGEPRHVPELSSEGDEWFPTITRSGWIYFGSDRPGGRGATDLWRARWDGSHFSAPENLGPPVNTSEDEIEPFVDPNGRYLIFAARRSKGGAGAYDLYISYLCSGRWSDPRQLPGLINSPAWDFAPRLSPDGRHFYFTSNRETPGSQRRPYSLRELNARYSRPGNGLRDIYRIEASALPLSHAC